MTYIAIVLAVVLMVVPRAWAEEPAANPHTVTTTTAPGERGYHPHPSDPRGLPTGLPGMGMPSPRPADEREKPTPPAGAQ
jgi:hypothetical protein